MADRASDWPRFADYRVVDRIGAGGMGEVFLAQRNGAADLCVLKRLRPEVAGYPEVRARFLREAEVCSLLSHPNIARLLDARIEGEEMFLAFEYVAGQDLEAIAKERVRAKLEPLPKALAIEVVAAVLEGLASAHGQKNGEGQPLQIVHRDISLRNLMISYAGEVKIIDFGLVRAVLGDLRTQTGMLMGTPRFMPPEQATGEHVDLRADLYSIGVVLFEILCGYVFIKGKKPVEILQRILAAPVPKISKLAAEVPETFDGFFEKALAKKAQDRFQNAPAMLEALREAAKTIPRPNDVKAALAEVLAPLFSAERARVKAVIEEARRARVIAPATRLAPAPAPSPELEVAPISIEPAPTEIAERRVRKRTRRPSPVLLGAGLFALAGASGALTYTVLIDDRERVFQLADAPRKDPTPQIVQRAARESEPVPESRLAVEAKLKPRSSPVIKTEAKIERPVIAEQARPFEDIRALLVAGDPRSLVAAETKIRTASDDLPAAARVAIADCLTSATTAPNATVWRERLGRCLDSLVREKANIRG